MLACHFWMTSVYIEKGVAGFLCNVASFDFFFSNLADYIGTCILDFTEKVLLLVEPFFFTHPSFILGLWYFRVAENISTRSRGSCCLWGWVGARRRPHNTYFITSLGLQTGWKCTKQKWCLCQENRFQKEITHPPTPFPPSHNVSIFHPPISLSLSLCTDSWVESVQC